MNSNNFVNTKIEFLKGVGPLKADVLRKELGISVFGDLIKHYPFRYIDRSKFHPIASLIEEMSYVQVKGTISNIKVFGAKRATRMSAILSDGTGQMELVWFQGIKWIKDVLRPQVEFIAFGKPSIFNGKFNMVHPDLEESSKAEKVIGPSLVGVYSTTEKCKVKGLDSKAIQKLMKTLLSHPGFAAEERLTPELVAHFKLMDRPSALMNIHLPADEQKLAAAEYRLKFEELFFIKLFLESFYCSFKL